MAQYIECGDAVKAFCKALCGRKRLDCNIECVQLRTFKINTPLADVEPVVHCTYIKTRGALHPLGREGICSNCGNTTDFYKFYHYCPKCGAKIDGESWERISSAPGGNKDV